MVHISRHFKSILNFHFFKSQNLHTKWPPEAILFFRLANMNLIGVFVTSYGLYKRWHAAAETAAAETAAQPKYHRNLKISGI